jgi:hypothetical protein
LDSLQTVSDDRRFPVEVLPNDNIQTIKERIQKLEAIPTDQQRLTFAGKPVLGNTLLSTIGENVLLHLIWEDPAGTPAEGKLAEPSLSWRYDPVYGAELGQTLFSTVTSTRLYLTSFYRPDITLTSGIAAEGTNTLPNSSIQQAPATQDSHNFNNNTATDESDAHYGDQHARGAQQTGPGHTYNENKVSGKAKAQYGNRYL